MTKPSIGSDAGTMNVLLDLHSGGARRMGTVNGLGIVDTAILTHLLIHKAHDHAIFNAQQTIAENLLCDVKTVMRSLKRLETAGYIEMRRRGMNKTSALFVNVSMIPARGEARSMPGAEAIELANDYITGVLGKKRVAPNFRRTQEFAAQRLIDAAGDCDLVRDLVNFAFDREELGKIARNSLFRVAANYEKIRAAFDAERTPSELLA